MPREVFVAGQVLTAAQLNVVSDQSVMVFAGTASRGSAIPSPTEGMMSYLEDSDAVQVYTTGWEDVGVAPAILQVVSTTKTDTFTMSSSTFADITGLSASITPRSTSSKIYVSASVVAQQDVGVNNGFLRLALDGTAIAVGDSAGSRVPVTAPIDGSATDVVPSSHSLSFLDSPSSTSALTYKVQIANNNSGSVFVNRADSDTDSSARGRYVSTITLMEIAG